MPPSYSSGNAAHHRRTESHQSYRTSTFPPTTGAPATTIAGARGSTMIMSPTKSRQYAHLHSQLAQLNAHLADTENLVRMTAVQAGDMRFLGGYVGGLFMGAAKVLGEEGVRASATGTANATETASGEVKKESD